MKNPLWTRNFSLLIAATTFGCMGGIVGNFALSFLVFDETGSTFASALVIAIQLIPNFFNPTVGCSLDGPLSQKTISCIWRFHQWILLCSYGNLFAVFRLFIRWLSWIFFASCYTGKSG